VACSGVAESAIDGNGAGSNGSGSNGAVSDNAVSAGSEAVDSNGMADLAAGNAPAASPETVARVVVERSRSLDGTNSAQAMAHFVELRAGADRSLELVGLHSPVQAPGQPCRVDFEAPAPNQDLVELELLDAGAVEIVLPEGTGTAPQDTGGPAVVTLAPHAFPSISSFASGLVYTTRDRSADTLPSGTLYDIRVNGARSIPRLEFSGQAPEELSAVTLGGVPLAAVRELDATAPLDVTWEVGRPSDVVVVEFANPDDGSRQLSCSFADDLGSASIAPQLLALTRGKTRLSVRRVRQVDADLGLSSTDTAVRGELRFDFEVNRALLMGDRVVIDPVAADPLQAARAEVTGTVHADSDALDTELSDSQLSDSQLSDSQLSDSQLSDSQLSDSQLSDSQIRDAASAVAVP
jgi:hypothetical protein